MRWPGGAGAKVGPQARVTRRRGRCKTEKEDEADISPGDKEEESSYTKKKKKKMCISGDRLGLRA